jgi:hypothetical protein
LGTSYERATTLRATHRERMANKRVFMEGTSIPKD